MIAQKILISQKNGADYELNDKNFPTIDSENPLKLTAEEKEIMDKLKKSFLHSEKLQRHTKFLFAKGSMFLKYNSNLLFHGCIPVTKEKEFTKVNIDGKIYGKNKSCYLRCAYGNKCNSR